MERIIKKDGVALRNALLLGFVPLLSVIFYCLVRGHTFWDATILTSEWNDELYYYKLVEGAVRYGAPLGYFGFNESHALVGSFAAWSPVLVWPWILWGWIFGWNLMSPIYCNLVVYCLTLFSFALLVKPSFKQTLCMGVIFLLFPLNARYILSTMPEVLCFSMLILFYGLAICYQKSTGNQGKKAEMRRAVLLLLQVLISAVMTLMRPYLILFLLLPMYFLVRDHRWKGFGCDVVILGVTGAAYVLIKHYLSAEYFTDLFSTEWVTNFIEYGLIGGFRRFLSILYYKGYAFAGYVLQGLRGDNATGAFFLSFLVVMTLLFVRLVISGIQWFRLHKNQGEKQKEQMGSLTVIWLHVALSFFAMLIALLLMYKLVEGSKHLLTFLAAAILLLPLDWEHRDFSFALKADAAGETDRENPTNGAKTLWVIVPLVITGLLFIYLYMINGGIDYDYSIPFMTNQAQERQDYWKEIFDREIVLDKENAPSYDNAVIWMFSDVASDQKDQTPTPWQNTDWQVLYATPVGTGISCCYQPFIVENLESLKCKYLCIPSGGVVDELCSEKNYQEIGRDKSVVVYKLH